MVDNEETFHNPKKIHEGTPVKPTITMEVAAGSSDDLMRIVSFSEVSNVLENIRRAGQPGLKLEVWKKYFQKFQESHKNKVIFPI